MNSFEPAIAIRLRGIVSSCYSRRDRPWRRLILCVAAVIALELTSAVSADGQTDPKDAGATAVPSGAADSGTGPRDRTEKPRVDLYGDPLPAGALLRLGTVRMRQEGHSQMSISYSSDGKMLATTDGDGVILWNAATGMRLNRLKSANVQGQGRAGEIDEIAFSPQIDELAARYNDGKLIVWDFATGNEFPMPAINPPPNMIFMSGLGSRGLVFAPSGALLAVNWGGKTTVFEMSSGRILHSIGADGDHVQFGLAWSPDSSQIVQGSQLSVARLFKVSGGEALRDFKADVDAFVLSLAISPDGQTLAGGCVQNQRAQIMICLWDVKTGKLKAKLPSEDPVSIHFTPDGKTLVSATEKGSIDVWDMEQGIKRHSIACGLGIARSAALSPDGKTIALGATNAEIGQWDVETGQKKLAEYVGHGREICATAYSPDGRLIATMSPNGDVRLWDATTGKQSLQFKSSSGGHLAFDPAGKQLATGGQGSGKVELWEVGTGAKLRDFDRNEKKIRQLGFTPDGTRLVTVGSNASAMWSSLPITDMLHIWDAASGEHLKQFELTAPTTESMLLMPDNRSVVLGAAYSADANAVQVRDLETGEQRALLHGHEASVNALDYSHGLVASGSRDKTIRLWDPQTWQEVAKLEGHKNEIKSVAFSPDGQWLVSCDLAGSVRVWNVKTRLQAYEFPPQEYGGLAVCFSPDGKRIVSALKNSTALVWDADAATN